VYRNALTETVSPKRTTVPYRSKIRIARLGSTDPIRFRVTSVAKMIGRNNNNKKNEDVNDVKSTSSLLSKETQDELKERREVQNLFARFKRVASDSLERISRQEEQGRAMKYQMGIEDARIMQNMNGVGLMEGAFAGKRNDCSAL
jgi:hypothetical protein